MHAGMDDLDRRRIPGGIIPGIELDQSRRTTLFIRGISPFTTAKELSIEFSKFGQVLRCDIPVIRGISKG